MDSTALSLCMDNHLPINVFNMNDESQHRPDSLRRAGGDAGETGMIDELLQDAREHMDKSVEATRHKFGSVRTGRASAALLDRIMVDYYGAKTPLKQLATVSAPEARLLTVQPYDKSSIKNIERAILESDVGLTPNNDGQIIRLQVPELTEERRKELVKVVRNLAEEGRVAIRNIRRDVMHDLRELRDAGEAGSDDEHRAEEALQKLTDEKVKELDGAPQGQGRRDPRGVSASYVAIITDGNGRWARQRGLPVEEGHRAGADTVKARLRDAVDLGVRELTVYSFSTENWSRPPEEVAALMAMFSERILAETPELDDEGVRMRFIGRREGVDAELLEQMRWAEEQDRRPTTGSRCSSPSTTAAGRRSSTPRGPSRGTTEEEFRALLYAPDMHDPDLIIRTSGEQRLSNYLLWQSAYSELHFTEVLWPDFSREDFEAALGEFEVRRRRFGGR